MAEKIKTADAAKIKVTLTRGVFGRSEKQQRTVQALGLTKINSSAVHNDNDAIRGMLSVVSHLVKVEAAE
jgi:large subunit ribosomal protein L30